MVIICELDNPFVDELLWCYGLLIHVVSDKDFKCINYLWTKVFKSDMKLLGQTNQLDQNIGDMLQAYIAYNISFYNNLLVIVLNIPHPFILMYGFQLGALVNVDFSSQLIREYIYKSLLSRKCCNYTK